MKVGPSHCADKGFAHAVACKGVGGSRNGPRHQPRVGHPILVWRSEDEEGRQSGEWAGPGAALHSQRGGEEEEWKPGGAVPVAWPWPVYAEFCTRKRCGCNGTWASKARTTCRA